jgi:hypothetical protein
MQRAHTGALDLDDIGAEIAKDYGGARFGQGLG